MNKQVTGRSVDLCFQIREFQFTPSRNELAKTGEVKTLEPRLVALLKLLCEAEGRTVSREEIMDHVWAGVAVTDLSITRAVSDLRKFLTDDVKNPQIIGTVRKVGYRLLIPVTTVTPASPVQKAIPQSSKRIWVGLGVAMVVLTLLLWPGKDTPIRDWELIPVAVTNQKETASSIANDGNQVIFSKEFPQRYELWHWNSTTSEKSLIYTSDVPIVETVWSRDSQSVIYCAWNQDKMEVYKIFAKPGATPTKFAEMPMAMILGITLLDDDHLLLSMGRGGSEFLLYQVDLKTGERSVFLEPEPGQLGFVYPKTSPDGSKIAYCFAEDPNTIQLEICDRTGKRLKVFKGNHYVYDLDWINNRELGFISMDTHKPKLTVLNLESGREETRPLGSSHAVSLEFAENLVIDHLNLDIDIVTYHLSNGIKRLTESVLIEFDASYVPALHKMAYLSNETNRFQIVIRQDNGDTSLVPHKGVRLSTPRWNHAGTVLAFIDQGEKHDRIYLYHERSQSKRLLFSHGAIGQISGFSKNDQLLYCRINDAQFKGVVALSMDGEIVARYANAWKMVDTDNGLFFNRLDDIHLWKIGEGSRAEQVMPLSLGVGSSWDIHKGRFYMIDRLNRLSGYDLATHTKLFIKSLDFTIYAIGNLTVIDEETFCFDYPKNSHGDVYFGRLK